MIDSAKVLSVDQSFTHSRFAVPGALLTQVTTSADFDILKFAERDKELSWRDLAVASSFLQVALETATVWSFPVDRPRISNVVAGTLAFVNNSSDRLGNAEGNVVHVLNSSIPSDAIFADKYLYNRDAVLHEVIVRASRVIKGINLTALFPSLTPVVAWSKAEGAKSDAGVALSKPLDTGMFKTPDQNLAERDNQLAGYVARLVHALMNPFEVANRLLVEVVGTSSRAPEVYSLLSSNDAQRVWGAEPALSNRMRIVYDRNFKTLRWVDESPLASHIPQPIPIALTTSGTAAGTLQFSGIAVGQQVVVRSESPVSPTVDSMRVKSGKVNFPGTLELDGSSFPSPVSYYLTAYPVAEYNDVVMLATGHNARFVLGAVTAGSYRVSVLIKPDKEFDLLGARNWSGMTGVYPGADCPGGQSIDYRLSLPSGSWRLRMEYTASTAGIVTFGGDAVSPAQSVAVGSGSGITTYVGLNSSPLGTLRITVPPGIANLYIKRFMVESLATEETCDYGFTAIIEGGHSKYAVAEFCGKNKRTDVMSFDFTVDTTVSPMYLSITMTGQTVPIPIRLKSFQVQAAEIQVPTPDAGGLDYWKYEMVNRASRMIARKYLKMVSGVLPKQYTPPPADMFVARSMIDIINSGVLVGSSAPFTKEDGEPEHAGNAGGKSGWWKWLAPSTGEVTLRSTGFEGDGVTNSGTSFNALLAVYTGSAVDDLVLVASSGTGLLTFVASAGVEYQIVVDGYDGEYGAVAISMETAHPSNELFDNGLEVTNFVRGLKYTAVTTGWVHWTAGLSGAVHFDASESTPPPMVYVYTGATEGTLSLVVSGSGSVDFTAVAGTTYRVKTVGAGSILIHIGPNFLNGGYWTTDSTNYWMTVVESEVSDVKSTFRPATPGDVGKPALVPRGLEVNSSGQVVQNYNYDDLHSEIVALQPWMLEIGAYVAKREFWPAECELSTDELAQDWPDTFFMATEVEGAGVLYGSGYYTEGSTAVFTAIPDPTPIVGIKPVDIIFAVDESGSMDTEHAWLQFLPSQLEAALTAAGIGVSQANRYGLIGFGSNISGHGTGQRAYKRVVGSGDWGTAAQLEASAAGLIASGGSEDGYDAIDLVFRSPGGYSFRAGAVVVVVLITDEDRTVLNSAATLDGVSNLLLGNVFAAVLNLNIKTNSNVAALGSNGTSVGSSNAYVQNASPPPYYTTAPLGSITAGAGANNSAVVAEYVSIATNVNGTVWDLNKLRSGGATAVAFSNAWTDIVKNTIIVASQWQFSRWLVDGVEVPGTVLGGYHVLQWTVTRPATVKAVFA